jgi:type III secretion system FlhB-like substrate exporter
MGGVKKASAIAYTPEMIAPRIVAAGRGREAERIIALARDAGVAVLEAPELEALLDVAQTGDYIPEWCWETMAKILAWVIAEERR